MNKKSKSIYLASLICLSGVAITIGCAAETRAKWMHFFFEIPPETPEQPATPAAPMAAGERVPETFTLPPARFAVVHNPVLTRECGACHDVSNQMAPKEDLADACKTCHTEFQNVTEGHEPAMQGMCTVCHEMHRSQIAGLLRQPVIDTCTECHDDPEDLSEEAHGVAGVEQCTNCHDPHFGAEFLLKPGYKQYMGSTNQSADGSD